MLVRGVFRHQYVLKFKNVSISFVLLKIIVKITHFGERLTFFQQKCEIFTKMKDIHENLTKKCKSAHNSPLLNTYTHLYLFQIF